MNCAHCRKRLRVYHRRGLCFRCYHTPAVRAKYTPDPKAGVQTTWKNGRRRLPAPTDSLPGTPERLAVMAERAAANQRLWSPADRTGIEGD